MTSLDELLEVGENPAHRPPSRALAWWLLRAGLLAAALAIGLVLVASALGYLLWFPLAFAGVFALLVLRRAVRSLNAVSLVDRREPDPDHQPPPDDGLGRVVRHWQTRITWDRAGRWRSAAHLRPNLAELVDERLRQRHGLARDRDAARARAVLGERLWSYLSQPKPRLPPGRELAVLLDDVERM